MKIIGKETIHPFLFYSGKTAGYIIWVLYVTAFFELTNIKMISFKWLDCVSYFTFLLGLFFIILSLINLGKSTSLVCRMKKLFLLKKDYIDSAEIRCMSDLTCLQFLQY